MGSKLLIRFRSGTWIWNGLNEELGKHGIIETVVKLIFLVSVSASL